MRHVAFIANFHLTETFLAISHELGPDTEVHWFTLSRRWASWLRSHGQPEERVVFLGDSDRDSAHLGPALPGTWSRQVGEIAPLEAIESDRVLRQRPLDMVIANMLGMSARFVSELQRREITIIFGEATWSTEIVLAYAAREAGIPWLIPHTVRYPSGRFGFFPAPSNRDLLRTRAASADGAALAEATVAALRSAGERPEIVTSQPSPDSTFASRNHYSMDRFVSEPRLLIEKARLAVSDSRDNPTQMNLREYLRSKNPLELRRRTHHGREVMRAAEAVPADPDFLLMPLQVQPEASVDVLAWHSRDQLDHVSRVARAARALGLRVGVKDHSHQFGSRTIGYYEQVLTHPGVFLIDPQAPSRPWLDASRGVVTPTGTMALEAAMLGKPAIVSAPIFFDILPTVRVLEPGWDRLDVPAVLPRASADCAARAYLETIVDHSFPGIVAAPRGVPHVLAKLNVERLARGFREAIDVSGDTLGWMKDQVF